MGRYDINQFGCIYEINSVSGRVVLSMDNEELQSLSFNERVKLEVILDAPGDVEAEIKRENTSCSAPPLLETQNNIGQGMLMKDVTNEKLENSKLSVQAGQSCSAFGGSEKDAQEVSVESDILEGPCAESASVPSKKPKLSQDGNISIQTKVPLKRRMRKTVQPKKNSLSFDSVDNSVSFSKNRAFKQIKNEIAVTDVELKVDAEEVETTCEEKCFDEEVNEKRVTCEVCGSSFSQKKEYFNHRLNKDKNTRKREYTCELFDGSQEKREKQCDRKFKYKANLLVHNLIYHSSAASLGEAPAQEAGEGKNTQQYACSFCELKFNTVSTLNKHMREHTGECMFRCCSCGKGVENWNSHAKTHIAASEFRCLQCNLKFLSRGELRDHQKTHEIKCGYCGKVFCSITSRTVHLRLDHPEEALKCSICLKFHNDQDSLDKHLRYHRYRKTNQCPTCGAIVRRLDSHMALHEQEEKGVKAFVCDKCPMQFPNKSRLNAHYSVHTGEKPHACDYCPMKFRLLSTLGVHIKTHTHERTFECEVCGKRTATSYNMKIHKRIHSSQKSFPCLICDQGFNYKASLKGHMLSRHSVDMDAEHKAGEEKSGVT